MAKEEQYSNTINRVIEGLDMNSDPINQPDNTMRFGLNVVEETVDGQHHSKSNESSNYACTTRPDGFELIGDRYIEDDTTVVICTNPVTGRDEIALLQKDSKYRTLVNTGVLGLKITNQCDIRYRLRRGKEHVIYWVDGLNNPRTFNYDRPYNFYNRTYQSYLRSGSDPNTFIGEKWDANSFDLQKSYNNIPFFSDVDIIETGSILPGSYNFAIQYVDEDLNPTAWITTSNSVNIYNDSTNNPYARIRGSRNIDTTSQSFPRANKSIKLTISNFDTTFPYYRVAIVRAAGNNGEVEKVLASDLYSTSDSNFIYTGNDASLKEVALGDILIDSEVIFAPEHIEQLEHRLILGSTKGKQVNYCDFQKYASKVATDIAYKGVLLNNILSEPNIKNAKSTFVYRGYMPGEVYSMGIVYIFSDNTVSPAFHIPGKSSTGTSDMQLYEIDGRYLDIHNCSTQNFWGRDSEGNTLVGKKIRHHRFPFRKDVTKPLYTTNTGITNINKYKLQVTITLNPAWTPGPIEYPHGGTPDAPYIIPYIINYQIAGNPTINNINRLLVDSDMGLVIDLYDDVTPLDIIDITEYGMLDPTSELATTYQISGNEQFLLNFDYTTYVASSSINTDSSEIFGLEFSNIERPHPDIIGFYIVRNERLDDDRIILDNAIFGSMTEFQQYKSFGLLMPKQFYAANNCGRIGNSGKTLGYYQKGIWFFNPEFEFYNKRAEFNEVEIEGSYTETSVDMPTISDTTGYPCNGGPSSAGDVNGGTKGVYINDVQAGTSYDPAVNKKKNKDDDGFDLVIGYRNTNVGYNIENSLTLPSKKRAIYLNAASSQTIDSDVLYNTSIDNKIGLYLSDNTLATDLLHNTATNVNKLLYGSLVRNSTSAYSNFITRAYYKEHNNPILFGANNIVNNVEIFNGDAQISAMTLVSSVFYDMVVADRPKKSGLWKIIVGAILVVAGVVLTIVGVGPAISAAGIALISGLAVSYGVSLVMSGIKFEQFKAMVDIDYEKGLKETVVDGGVFETVRDTIGQTDDTVRWFSDRVSNIYIESSVPVGLRSGLTGGITDFVDAPKPYNELEFRSYLTEKMTVVDRDQGSGRLYKGYASAEIYDANLDYIRFNKQKNFVHLPIEYDCCSDNNEVHPLRMHWSEVSFQEEKVDNYRVFLPNNYRDIEGEHGQITNLYKLGKNLFIHTKEALWHLPQNNQERVTGEIVSFIGTGEFFNIMPTPVLDDNLGSGGTSHKWATVKTKYGVISVSEIEHKVHLHSGQLKDLTPKMRSWFAENMKGFLVGQLFDTFGVEFLHPNNPANKDGVGYISTFDTRYNRVIITKKDFLIVSDWLNIMELAPTKPTVSGHFVYAIDDGKFYMGTQEMSFDDIDVFEDKSWTISYSFNTNMWLSLHSYLPNYYIHSQNSMYASWIGDKNIWKFNKLGNYQNFRGIRYPFIIELVAKSNPLIDSIISGINFNTKARRWDEDLRQFVEEKYITFNKVILNNQTQCSGELEMVVKEKIATAATWYTNSVKNEVGKITVSKSTGNWNIDQLIDYIITENEAVFSNAWADIRSQYPIDKVPNLAAIDLNRNWNQLARFKGKYIVIRLKFDNFDNVNLIMNYSVTTEQKTLK